jgi:hypothetical protein
MVMIDSIKKTKKEYYIFLLGKNHNILLGLFIKDIILSKAIG